MLDLTYSRKIKTRGSKCLTGSDYQMYILKYFTFVDNISPFSKYEIFTSTKLRNNFENGKNLFFVLSSRTSNVRKRVVSYVKKCLET